MAREEEVELVRRAIEGDPRALRTLVQRLTPVVQQRVGRALLRSGVRSGRPVGQDVEDLAQEIFAYLFTPDARALRQWDPERGNLSQFVSMVSKHKALSLLRSPTRSPYAQRPEDPSLLDAHPSGEAVVAGEAEVESRSRLERLTRAFQREATATGLKMFELIFVFERSTEEVGRETGQSPDAIYQWRQQLKKLARRIEDRLEAEEARGGLEPRATRKGLEGKLGAALTSPAAREERATTPRAPSERRKAGHG